MCKLLKKFCFICGAAITDELSVDVKLANEAEIESDEVFVDFLNYLEQ